MATTYPFASSTATGNGTAATYDYSAGLGGTPTGMGNLSPQDWRNTVNTVTQVVSSVLPSILSLLQTQPQFNQFQPQGYYQPQGQGYIHPGLLVAQSYGQFGGGMAPAGYAPGLSPLTAGLSGGQGAFAPQGWFDIIKHVASITVPAVLSALQSQPQFGQFGQYQPQGYSPTLNPLAAGLPGIGGALAPQDWRHTVNTVSQVVTSVLPSILSLLQTQPQFNQFQQFQPQSAIPSPFGQYQPYGIGAYGQTPGFGGMQPSSYMPGFSPLTAGLPAGMGTLAPQGWFDIVSKIVSTTVPIALSVLQTTPAMPGQRA